MIPNWSGQSTSLKILFNFGSGEKINQICFGFVIKSFE